jgi:hypothetical protein
MAPFYTSLVRCGGRTVASRKPGPEGFVESRPFARTAKGRAALGNPPSAIVHGIGSRLGTFEEFDQTADAIKNFVECDNRYSAQSLTKTLE